jgi:hypothetical protein
MRHYTPSLNNKGLSVIEIIVSLLVLVVVILASNSQLTIINQFIVQSARDMAASQLANKMIKRMDVSNHCSQSLRGLAIGPNLGDTTIVDKLVESIEDPSNPGVFLSTENDKIQINQIYNNIKVKRMLLTTEKLLNEDEGSYVVNFKYLLEDAFSNKKFNFPEFKIVVKTNPALEISSCYDFIDEKAMKEKYCVIQSRGYHYIDPTTGVCKVNHKDFFLGSSDSASCPTNYEPDSWSNEVCANEPPSGYVDNTSVVSRDYDDGSTINGAPLYYKSTFSSGTCHCVYASDIPDTSDFKCKILCIRTPGTF